MTVVQLAAAARRDLESIYEWVAFDAPARARRYLLGSAATLDRLADASLLGRARLELAPGLRSFPCRRHVVFYRPIATSTERGIRAIRILHGRQDIGHAFP